jgi:hypothetical protein
VRASWRGAVPLAVAFAAAYVGTWGIGKHTYGGPTHQGPRVPATGSSGSFSKLGYYICEYAGPEHTPQDIVARTPMRNSERLAAFLDQNQNGFRALRRELTPYIYQAADNAHRCFVDGGVSEAPVMEIEWHIKSTRHRATASNFRIRTIQGGSARGKDVARMCFGSVFGGAAMTVTEAESGPFLDYDGIYPGTIPIHLGKGDTSFTGKPLAPPMP